MYYASVSTQVRRVRTGSRTLDKVLEVSGGIITLRSTKQKWLSKLAAGMLVLNHTQGTKSLLLNWLDYHSRYWSLDLDYIIDVAKRMGFEPEEIASTLMVHRCFSRDNVESEEFWGKLSAIPKELNMVVLDSFSELFESDPVKPANKPKLFSASMFSRFIAQQDCIGIVLDYSKRPLNPFLGELSSVIVEFQHDDGLYAKVTKHPYLPDPEFEVPIAGQQSLRRWNR